MLVDQIEPLIPTLPTVGGHGAAIRELMQPADPSPRRGRIGFGREHET